MIRRFLLARTWLPPVFLFCITICLPTAAESGVPDVSTAAEVIDGDTIVLATGDRVRLIGIDAPEVVDTNARNSKTAKYEGVRKAAVDLYAIEAQSAVRDWVSGQTLRIVPDAINADREHRDDYGRVLAYVCRTSDDRCLGEDLLAGGYALVYRRFSFERKDKFLAIEKKARKNGRGLWKHQLRSESFEPAKKTSPKKTSSKKKSSD